MESITNLKNLSNLSQQFNLFSNCRFDFFQCFPSICFCPHFCRSDGMAMVVEQRRERGMVLTVVDCWLQLEEMANERETNKFSETRGVGVNFFILLFIYLLFLILNIPIMKLNVLLTLIRLIVPLGFKFNSNYACAFSFSWDF